MVTITQLLAWSGMLTASFARPSVSSAFETRATNSSTPLPPKQDPFYTAPPGFEAAAPGTVLRIRQAQFDPTTIYNASTSAYTILYRTTNSLYQPSWAVTTLFIPSTPTQNFSDNAILSYQIPYNTANPDQVPSYLLANPAFTTGLVQSDINTALSYGWYVNVPDFEGPLAAFASGVEEGHATLDSIRAVLSSPPANLTLPSPSFSNTTRVALWGYSGGSLASEWAAELAEQYAPDLQLHGMAIGGVVPNVTAIIAAIDATPAAWLIPNLLLGLTAQHPRTQRELLAALHPTGPFNASTFLSVRNGSLASSIGVFANQSVLSSYFVNGSVGVLDSPAVRRVFDSDAFMGYHGVPRMPVFVYKAVQDEYSPIDATDALVARYCGVGTDILYQRNEAGNHLDEETNGDARALAWLRLVLEGDGAGQATADNTTVFVPRGGCTVQNVSVAISVHEPFYYPPGF